MKDIHAETQLGRSALTPLLDVLFLLLFAVLATAERDKAAGADEVDAVQELDVRLPELAPSEDAAAAPGTELRVELLVEVDGTVLLRGGAGDRAVRTPSELTDAFAALEASGGQVPTVVEVRADADARHAVVVEVLQTLRSLGIADVRYVAAVDRSGATDRAFGGRSE